MIVKLGPEPIEYTDWIKLQIRLVEARKSCQIGDRIYVLEHQPVITIGRSAKADEYLLADRSNLTERGIQAVDVDRGGDITYHGPGQTIVYPIIDLEPKGRDLHKYIRGLELCVIEAIGVFGAEGHTIAGMTGVWVGGSKIAAIGIKVSRWVTSHGVAINNTVDLSTMRQDIVPCGLVGKTVTSLNELGIHVERSVFEVSVAECLCRFLGLECQILSSDINNEHTMLDNAAYEVLQAVSPEELS